MLDRNGKAQKQDEPIGIMKKPRLVSEVCRRVADKVADVAGMGQLPLTLGGDHSLVRLHKIDH
jgi:arginase